MTEWWRNDSDPFDVLPLLVRNVLRNNGIKTIEQLRQCEVHELRRMPNMGSEGIKSIAALLRLMDGR